MADDSCNCEIGDCVHELVPSQRWRDRMSAENARLRERNVSLKGALMGMRRSDGHGGHINCWCDSEWGASPKDHAQYCLDARRVMSEED